MVKYLKIRNAQLIIITTIFHEASGGFIQHNISSTKTCAVRFHTFIFTFLTSVRLQFCISFTFIHESLKKKALLNDFQRKSQRLSSGHFGKYHNTLCLSPQSLLKHCFQFLLGLTMVPRENKNNAYAKFGGDKQRVLWDFPKWPIGTNNFTIPDWMVW